MSQPSTAISHHCVVSITWIIKDLQGGVLDVLDTPIDFLIGGDDMLEAISSALLQHNTGDTVHLQLEPEQAFGDYDEQKVYLEQRSHFPDNLEVGMIFEGQALPSGCDNMPKDAFYVVTDIYPEHVILDANHPLAGIGIDLQITIHAARNATPEEIHNNSAGAGFFRIADTHLPDNRHSDTLH